MRIGVDLGGTNVRAGLVKDGHIVRLLSEPCKADRPEGEVVDHIASLIGELMRPEVSRIGIGVPSVVDAARGIVYNVVGIPSWREVYLKDLLEKRFSVPVHVNNDCNCFALGVCRFGEALIEKNAVMNLTAITEPSAVAQLHFLDCIALLNAADFHGKRVIDVGCGAGFPGVPLKIAEPSIRLTLLDSLAKRMNWLSETLPALGVDAEIITARAEEFAAQRREQYDLATSRAVARLNVLAELCLPYVRVGGKFLAMKGALAQEEVEEARRGIEKLGGHVLRIFEYPVADAVHKAVVIEKLRPTPPQYPRAFAKIKKSPL